MTNLRTQFPFAFGLLVVIGSTFVLYGPLPVDAATLPTDLEVAKRYQSDLDLSKPINGANGSGESGVSGQGKTVQPVIAGNANAHYVQAIDQRIANLAFFSLGLTGIAIYGLANADRSRKDCKTLRQKLRDQANYSKRDDKKISELFTAMNHEVSEALARVKAAEIEIGQLNIKYTSLYKRFDNQVPSSFRPPLAGDQISLNQTANMQRSSSSQPRTPVPAFDGFGQTQPPSSSWQVASAASKTAAQQQEELTAAVNSNDRPAVRSATRTQLNITSDSDNAIAIGRLTSTELEEVSGGGSYLLMEIENQALIYPTEQTLNGFIQLQPAKGVFAYLKQPISAPQVIAPALVQREGNYWRVQQLGTIAVPA